MGGEIGHQHSNIAHHEEPEIGPDQVDVLVVVPNPADVAERSRLPELTFGLGHGRLE